MTTLKYLNAYPEQVQARVLEMIAKNQLGPHLAKRYPNSHNITNDKALYEYIAEIRMDFLKNTPPLSKALYDSKIKIIQHALGTHSHVSRVQGDKLKSKNEIRIASLFKTAPPEFLRMIVVHELSHFKIKEHNKAFYQLCQHIEPNYMQLEFDLRLYLTHQDM
jgi:UTP pyrophosphatase